MLASSLCFGALIIACCTFADRLGHALGVIDHPDGARKIHARPTPLVGGIALMGPLLVIIGMQFSQHPESAAILTALAIAIVGFVGLGWYDDRHHLTPATRLWFSVSFCLGLVAFEPALRLEHVQIGPIAVTLGALAVPLTVLCLVGLQNAINMADGINGLVIGLSIFWAICLLLYAPDSLQFYLAFLLVGLLILLPYNLLGFLFLGDAGSYSLGVTTGLLMIYVYSTTPYDLPVLTVVVWLLVPVLDCLRVIAARLADTRSPLTADRNHLHHRLARFLQWPASMLVYLAVAALPGLIAALWPETTLAMLALGILVYGSVIWLTRERHVPVQETSRAQGGRPLRLAALRLSGINRD
jgi:UDP-GlcNAc:undecaprenyl-phosphate GlcNAc-1-phosphate transferase